MSVGRREFITLLAGAAALPLAACTQDDRVRDLQMRMLRLQAESAAAKIGRFIEEIVRQVGWTTLLPWSTSTIERRRFDAQRLLRQVPAITTLRKIDSTGVERLTQGFSDCYGFGCSTDFSRAPEFTVAMEKDIYYGPVYFRRESEPYMTLSLAGTRRDDGVSLAEVNLKLVWDVVSQIKVWEGGAAYLVDARGRLIAHPDISLVLRNTDMTGLPQVAAARAAVSAGAGAGPDSGAEQVIAGKDMLGHEVLSAYAPIAPLGWLLFVEVPLAKADEPLNAALLFLFRLLLGGLTLTLF
jgi:hypothetical protein